MAPPVRQWRFDLATVSTLRSLVYVAVGCIAGPLVGVVAAVSWTLATADVGLAVVAVVLALVVGVGVGSGRAVFALLVGVGVDEDVRSLSRRWLVGSALVGAGLSIAVLVTTDVGGQLLLGGVVVGFAALVLGAGLRSEGSVDPDEGTVEYGGRTLPLDAVRGVRSVRVGRFVLVLLRYHAGRVGPSTPRLLVVSAAGRDAMRSYRTTHDAVPSDNGRERGSTAVRLVAGAFGVACVSIGPVLWLSLPNGRLLAAYLGAFGLLFGGLFLRYALVA